MTQLDSGNAPANSARDKKENKAPTARPKSTIESATRPVSRATTSAPRPASRATGATASSARNATARAATPSTSTPLRSNTTGRSKPDEGKKPVASSSARLPTSASKSAAGGLMGSRYAADESSPTTKPRSTTATAAPSKPTSAAAKRLSGNTGSASLPDKDQGRNTPTRLSTTSTPTTSSSVSKAAAARPIPSASKTTARSSTGSRSSTDASGLSKSRAPKPATISTARNAPSQTATAQPIKLASPISLEGPTVETDAPVVSQTQSQPSKRKDIRPDESISVASPQTPENIKSEPLAASKYAESPIESITRTSPHATSADTVGDSSDGYTNDHITPDIPQPGTVESPVASSTDSRTSHLAISPTAAHSTKRPESPAFVSAKIKRMHAKYVVDNAAMQGTCLVSKEEYHPEIRQHINEYAQSLMEKGEIESCHLEEMGLSGGLEVVVTGGKSAANGEAEHSNTTQTLQQLHEDLESKTKQFADLVRSRDMLQSELSTTQAELATAKTNREASQNSTDELDNIRAELATAKIDLEALQKLKDELAQKSKLLEEARAASVTAISETEKLTGQNRELLEARAQLGKEANETESQLIELRDEMKKVKQDAARVPELLAELETCKKVLKEIEGSREQVFERSLESHRQQVASLETKLKVAREETSNSVQRQELEAQTRAQAEARHKANIEELQKQVTQLEAELKSADEALDVSRKFAKHASDEKAEIESSKDKEIQAQREEMEAFEKELEAMRKSVKASEQRADNEVGFRALHEKEAEQQINTLRSDIDKLRLDVAAAEKRADHEARSREEVEQRGDKALQEQRRELADECVKLSKELEARKQAFQRLEDFFRADEEKIPEMQTEIDTLEAKVENLEQNNAALRDSQKDDEVKIKQLEGQLSAAQDTSTTHGSRITELETLLINAQEADKANEALTKQLEELEAALAAEKSTNDTHQAKTKQLAAQIDRLIGDRKNIQFERDQFEEDKDRIERKLTDITSSLSLSYGQGMTRLRDSGIDSDELFNNPRMHSRTSSETGFSLLEEINRSRAVLDAFTRFNPPEDEAAVDAQLQALLDMGMPVPPGSVEEPFVPVHWKNDVSKHLEAQLNGLREELDKVMKYMNLDKNHFLHEWHIAETFGHLQVERLQRISDDYMALVDAVVEKVATKDHGVSKWATAAAQEQRNRSLSHSSSHSTTREGSVESVVFSNNGGSPLTTLPETNGIHYTPSIERLLDAQRMTDASLMALANKVRSIRSFHDNRHLVS